MSNPKKTQAHHEHIKATRQQAKVQKPSAYCEEEHVNTPFTPLNADKRVVTTATGTGPADGSDRFPSFRQERGPQPWISQISEAAPVSIRHCDDGESSKL